MKGTEIAWGLTVWGSATAMALFFAHTTRLGPSVHVWATHGVHAGDVAAFALAYAFAALLTLRRRRHR